MRDTKGVPVYRDEGIVLRTQRLGEADRIITLFTRDHGRIRAVAKGVRKTGSRFGSRLEPFGRVDVQLYEGRTLDTVTQVETLDAHGPRLTGDYGSWTAGTAMLEATERLTPVEGEPTLPQYVLLVGALRTLVARTHDSGLVLDAFILRSLAIAGWSPSFADCARCGQKGPHRAFAVSAGGVLCSGCRVPGSAAPALETLALLGALLSGDWSTADGTDTRHRRESTSLTAALLTWHLERGLRSWPLVERA
jgi:DNA repair protein RecO (recombination protein O)